MQSQVWTPLPYVTSIHDGHHQTEVRLGLERIGQRHNEPAVYFGQDPLLNNGALEAESCSSVLRNTLWGTACMLGIAQDRLAICLKSGMHSLRGTALTGTSLSLPCPPSPPPHHHSPSI